MEIQNIASEIEARIKMLATARKMLREAAENKANAIANYERELSKVIIGLKNGKSFEVDGEQITNPPATILERIARGVVYNEKLASELADNLYKNTIVGTQAIQAELNGYQSIFRYLDEK